MSLYAKPISLITVPLMSLSAAAISSLHADRSCRLVAPGEIGSLPRIASPTERVAIHGLSICQVRYLELSEHSVFASQYADLAQRIQRLNLFLVVVVSGEDGQIQYDYTSKSGGAGWEVLSFYR